MGIGREGGGFDGEVSGGGSNDNAEGSGAHAGGSGNKIGTSVFWEGVIDGEFELSCGNHHPTTVATMTKKSPTAPQGNFAP